MTGYNPASPPIPVESRSAVMIVLIVKIALNVRPDALIVKPITRNIIIAPKHPYFYTLLVFFLTQIHTQQGKRTVFL